MCLRGQETRIVVVVCGFVRRGVMEKKGIPDKDGYCPRAANFLPAVPSIDSLEKET